MVPKEQLFSERTSNINNLFKDHNQKQPVSATTQIVYNIGGSSDGRARLMKNKYKTSQNCGGGSGLQILTSKSKLSDKENKAKCDTPLSGYFQSLDRTRAESGDAVPLSSHLRRR